jgi:sugar transferase (PEP-CTERM system associated)
VIATGLEKHPDLEQRTARKRAGEGWRKFGPRKRVLIVGHGELAEQVCHALLCQRKQLWEVVGFLADTPARNGKQAAGPRVIGTIDQLFETVERYHVHTVAVCLEDRRTILPVQTLLDFKAMGLGVVDGHELYERVSGRLSIDQLKPSALIFSSGFQRLTLVMGLKRLLDIVASSLGFVLLLPLGLAIAALIKLDSPGPVFYRQTRVGLHGQPYVMWKFRSMAHDAENSGVRWAALRDPRVTRIGRWLRKWRIDELPQLINVLKGEMSLVGPRPERPMFVQGLRGDIPFYDVRHTVRPGITGWAQIRFRYAASTEDTHVKLQYDLYYVKNLSLWLDLRILFETIRVVLAGKGAR